MDILVIFTITIFIFIAIFHFYWAFGGKLGLDIVLPTKDERRLINPSKYLTFLVGLFLLCFAFVTYMLYINNDNKMYIYLGWIISLIFIIRAIGDFNTIGFFKKIKSTKFALYDTRYFSPLSLYLGIVLAMMASKM